MRKVSKTRKMHEKKYAERIGSRLRDIRRAYGLTQGEVAELIGLEYGSNTLVSQQERGKIMPTIPSLLRYADYFRVPIDIFFCDEDDYMDAFVARFRQTPEN